MLDINIKILFIHFIEILKFLNFGILRPLLYYDSSITVHLISISVFGIARSIV